MLTASDRAIFEHALAHSIHIIHHLLTPADKNRMFPQDDAEVA
jgi:hypothetical protein